MAKPRSRSKTRPRAQQKRVAYRDAIQLLEGETLQAFELSLAAALSAAFEFPAPPDGWWCLKAVGDGWLVVDVYESGDEGGCYRASWQRADVVFSFGPFEEVREMVGYEPVGEMVQAKPVMEMPEVEDTTTGGDVATVAGGMGKKPKKKDETKIDHLEDWATKPRKFVDRGNAVTLQRVADAFIGNYPKTSPTGKAFIAVYRAGGTIVGRINRNDYLYQDGEIDDNIVRLKQSVVDAYQHKQDSGPNFAVADLLGEADHPGPFDGEKTITTTTMLLDIERMDNDVEIVFGLMDTSVGRDIQSLFEYGMPVATSMRSRGRAVETHMNMDDPYYDRNKTYDGQSYLKIEDLFIEAFDLVVRPASDTYVQARLGDDVKSKITGVLARLRDSVESKSEDVVENPTAAQREDLPKAAYAIAYKDDDGDLVLKLPHHINTVQDPNSDGTVDLPRLRNALARISMVKDTPPDVVERAQRHLEAHARRLGIGEAAKEDHVNADAELPPVEPVPVEEPAAEPADAAKPDPTEVPTDPGMKKPEELVPIDQVSALSAQLADLKAENAALRARLDELEAERKQKDSAELESSRVSAIEDAIRKTCEGRAWGEARSAFLREKLISDRTKAAGDVELADQAFESTFRSYLDAAGEQKLPAGVAKTVDLVPEESPSPTNHQPHDPLGGIKLSL